MKHFQLFVLLVLVAFTLGARNVTAQSSSSVGYVQSATGVAADAEQPSPVRILSPLPGQTLSANYVDVRFELTRPALSDEPNFLVQLDSSDPIGTVETGYTFPDLQPGVHIVRVTLVDANNVPVQGGTATVQFKVASATQPAHINNSNSQHFTGNLRGAAPEAPIPPELRNDGDPKLPLAGSPLPLISLIGFGKALHRVP
jgi:hypothetical protein